MSSQRLDLLVNANGTGSGSGPVGSGMQWFGGKARIYAWGDRASTYTVVNGSQYAADFSEPPILVRATAGGNYVDQNFNVTLIGYDQA